MKFQIALFANAERPTSPQRVTILVSSTGLSRRSRTSFAVSARAWLAEGYPRPVFPIVYHHDFCYLPARLSARSLPSALACLLNRTLPYCYDISVAPWLHTGSITHI